MSSVALLLGLLVVAYVGSQLLGGKGNSYRLASGAEYLLLGLALGPHALGIVERSTLEAFQPIALVGVAWLTLVIGADYGFQGTRRVSLRGLAAGVVLALVNVAVTAAGLHFVCQKLHLLEGRDAWLVPLGVGLVTCETTRHAVRWVLGRHAAEGPLTRLVDDLADSDDIVPIVGLAALFSLLGMPEAPIEVPAQGLLAATLGIGAVLGGTAAALLRSEPKASDGWGVLIGATLVATGTALHLGLAALAATFTLGLTLSFLSRHRVELRNMLEQTEQPVILPLLLLAGALVDVKDPMLTTVLLGGAIAVRVVLRLAAGPVLAALAGVSRKAAPALGVGLLPSGALSIIVGMGFANRIHGPGGDAVLAVAVGLTVLAELVGPGSLKRALAAAGEIQSEPTEGEPEAKDEPAPMEPAP